MILAVRARARRNGIRAIFTRDVARCMLIAPRSAARRRVRSSRAAIGSLRSFLAIASTVPLRSTIFETPASA